MVLWWVENSNAAGRTVPVDFVVLLADDEERHLRLPVEEVQRRSVSSVPSVSTVPLSPLGGAATRDGPRVKIGGGGLWA